MFSSNSFAFVDVLDKGADASYVRQTILAQNIANVDTPFYKRSEVEFSEVLKRELLNTNKRDVTGAVRAVDKSRLAPKVFEDMSNYSYRIDRNNVDVDTENVEIASEQLRYQAITTMVSNSFARFNVVTNS